MNLKSLVRRGQRFQKQLVYALLLGLGVYWLLRSCVPAFGNSLLPTDVQESITRSYKVCISSSDTPIWPGEPRQPECGQIVIEIRGEGVIPSEARVAGVSKAVCYKVTSKNPYWQTQGQTRHEVLWQSRLTSKVAVLQNNAWQTFPDRDDLDAQRWSTYSCPGAYESTSKPNE